MLALLPVLQILLVSLDEHKQRPESLGYSISPNSQHGSDRFSLGDLDGFEAKQS